MKIAFAGNPNSGKTTMYNALTGSNEKVGNWAGVTVDKKESSVREQYTGGERWVAVDLPGAYSMSPFTAEESITSSYIQQEAPDVIVNIVDATNLSRSLFFTTQLLELGIPMVVALNKSDATKKKHTAINSDRLSQLLGCPVVETASISGEGLASLARAVAAQEEAPQPPFQPTQLDLTDRESVLQADRERFEFVNRLVADVEKRQIFTRDVNRQDRLDNVLTHPVLGLLIFAGVMFLVFQISQAWLGPFLADWLVSWIDAFKEWVAGLLQNANSFLSALLTEGIIGGVSAVVGFLPLVMVMYFMIALLEDCGYMARATVVLDPIFKRVGLSGKSVIPFVVGTGCAIPGIMASRTIRNPRERNATAMLTPFMPCGAKLPVIALFSGAFFDNASWVGTAMYFIGIFLILVCALLVNRIAGYRVRGGFFIIELPEYKAPSLKRAFLEMCSRGWSYIAKAGTVILLCNAVIFIMQSFNWRLQLVDESMAHTSILATISTPVATLLIPIVGIAAWQLAAASITGFIAKENVVGTLAVCYGISNLINTEELALMEGAGSQVAAVFGITGAAALAYLMFNLFTPPCFAAIGAMNAELQNKKWFWGGIALQLAVGYTLGFITYQLGTLITTGRLGEGFIGGLCAVAVIGAVITLLCILGGKRERRTSV